MDKCNGDGDDEVVDGDDVFLMMVMVVIVIDVMF